MGIGTLIKSMLKISPDVANSAKMSKGAASLFEDSRLAAAAAEITPDAPKWDDVTKEVQYNHYLPQFEQALDEADMSTDWAGKAAKGLIKFAMENNVPPGGRLPVPYLIDLKKKNGKVPLVEMAKVMAKHEDDGWWNWTGSGQPGQTMHLLTPNEVLQVAYKNDAAAGYGGDYKEWLKDQEHPHTGADETAKYMLDWKINPVDLDTNDILQIQAMSNVAVAAKKLGIKYIPAWKDSGVPEKVTTASELFDNDQLLKPIIDVKGIDTDEAYLKGIAELFLDDEHKAALFASKSSMDDLKYEIFGLNFSEIDDIHIDNVSEIVLQNAGQALHNQKKATALPVNEFKTPLDFSSFNGYIAKSKLLTPEPFEYIQQHLDLPQPILKKVKKYDPDFVSDILHEVSLIKASVPGFPDILKDELPGLLFYVDKNQKNIKSPSDLTELIKNQYGYSYGPTTVPPTTVPPTTSPSASYSTSWHVPTKEDYKKLTFANKKEKEIFDAMHSIRGTFHPLASSIVAVRKAGTALGLNDMDIGAINFYTRVGDQFLNRRLRGVKTVTPDEQKSLDMITKRVNEALDKLHSIDGVVHRGISRYDSNGKDILRNYEVGKVVEEKAFTSTSLEKRGGEIIYKIKSKTGKHIEPVSDFRHEKEVLFKAGTKFKVVEIREDFGHHFIYMEEL